jgi:hypothetical protein
MDEMVLAGWRHKDGVPDVNGKPRRAIVFYLSPVHAESLSEPPPAITHPDASGLEAAVERGRVRREVRAAVTVKTKLAKLDAALGRRTGRGPLGDRGLPELLKHRADSPGSRRPSRPLAGRVYGVRIGRAGMVIRGLKPRRVLTNYAGVCEGCEEPAAGVVGLQEGAPVGRGEGGVSPPEDVDPKARGCAV